MEFSQSLALGNSTLENIESKVNQHDEIIDESPNNSTNKLGRKRPLTQNKRKLNSVPLKKLNNSSISNKFLSVNNDYSKLFNSSFHIEENISKSSNYVERIPDSSVEIFNTEDEKQINEIFNNCSDGFNDLLMHAESQKISSNNEEFIEVQEFLDKFESFDNQGEFLNSNQSNKIIESKCDEIVRTTESISREQQIIEDFSEWGSLQHNESVNEIILNIEDTSFITNLSKISDKNKSETEKDDFIKKELENSIQNIHEILNDKSNHSISIRLDNNQLNDSNITNNTSERLCSSENIKLVWSSTSDEDHESKNLSENYENDHAPNIDSLKTISSWNLPKAIEKQYESKGISKMFDWQVECLTIPKVLFEHGNLVYSAPTSAGKTLVSEILVIKTILERNKKALIILPFISVVREKMYYMQNLLNSSGFRVEGYFGGYSPPGGFDSVHVAICTIEKANSILNRLLEQDKLDDIGIIVMDEVHLISDSSRGYILELLLAKTLYMCRKYDIKIQIVTMSATLSNAELLKKWLQADLFISNYRPVELKEMIKIDSKIYDYQMNLIREIKNDDIIHLPKDHDHIAQLCLETILEKCSVIVFCPSKDWCETLCLHIAESIYLLCKNKKDIGEILRELIKKENIEEVKMQLKNIPTGLDSVLEKTITYGCAFHHAGLTVEERDLIEASFRNGVLKVIVATSTLSSGVNLPARRVIIRSPLFGGKTMDSLTYKQMIGRAGRTGKDTLGESILVCNEKNSKAGKELIGANLKPLSSCLEFENSTHLKRAILEVISSGVATTKQDVELFLSCTLMYTQNHHSQKTIQQTESDCTINEKSQKNAINECIEFLIEYEFIRLQNNEETNEIYYIPTRLGLACLSASMPPTDGIILLSELQKSRRCFVLESELHAIYLVTPYSVCYQVQDIDWLQYLDMWEKLSSAEKKVGELIGIKESFLVKAMRGNGRLDFKLLQVHKRFYIAMALQELVNEIPVNKVANKYQLSRGLLQSLQQISSTFAGIVTSFCNSLNWTMLSLIISQFKERLYFGIQNDLIDLMRLTDLNSQRARILYDAGIHTLCDLAKMNYLKLEKILYNCISFDLIKKKDDEDEYEAKKRNKIRNIYVTGKEGLTIKDAAKLLINDARKFLELEMGAKNINWDSTQNQESNEGSNKIKEENNIKTVFTSTPQTITAGNSKKLVIEDETCEENKNDIKIVQNSIENLNKVEKSPQIEIDPRSSLKTTNSSKISLKSKKISKSEKNMRLRKKMNPKNISHEKIDDKSITTPSNSHTKQKSRNSFGNKSVEEIANSQPENSSSTVTKKHVSRVLRTRLTQKQIQNEKENLNSVKCLNFEPDSIESNDIISDSDSLQKDLFKRPNQMNSSHILKDCKIESNSIDFDRLQIIDACGNLNLFEKVCNELNSIQKSIGFSVGIQKLINKRKPLIGDKLLINQNEINSNKCEENFIFDNDYFVSGISVCLEANIVIFINMQNENRDKEITNEMIITKIKEIFNNEKLILRIFDAKEQLKILKKILPQLNEIEVKIEDPKVANWLLQPENEMSFKDMVEQYAPEFCGIADIAGKAKTYSSIALNYRSSIIGKVRSTVESCVVLHVLENQLEKLNKIDNGHLKKFFCDLEMPIQISLFKMESIGFPVNEIKLENLLYFILETMKKIENKIYEIHGSRFNLSSSSAVARILRLNKKSSGKISTSKQILEKIDSPIANLIMNYRKLNSTLTKTIQPLSRCIVENRIHGRSLTFTATGRISMHEPNLQNVTKNFEIDFLGNEKILIACRSCFTPTQGKCLISADFCQLEMRILAHLSQDPILIKVIHSDTDVFTAIASKWNKISTDEVSEALRNGTKQICYGIIYGMGIKSLAESLKCDEKEASIVLEQFHLAYPGIRTYIEKVVRFVEQNGYVETITGRRRYLSCINSLDTRQKSQAIRQAVNTTVQGSAADISKNAILKMEKYLNKYKKKSNNEKSHINFVLHLHDELIFEVSKEKIPQISKLLKSAMENCIKLSVPLKVRLKVGDSWGEMNEYKI